MQKYFIGFILGFAVAITGTVLATSETEKPIKTEKVFSYVYLNMLHDIKINKVDEVEKSFEKNIEYDVISYNKSIEQSKSDPDEMNKFLILASVMNEKFEIQSWKSNAELQKAFSSAQQRDSKYTAEVRCRDWSQPMWAGKPKC
jgi:hypothetical protein